MSTRTTRPLPGIRLFLVLAPSLFFSGVVLPAQGPAPTTTDTKRVDAAPVSGRALGGQAIFRGKGTCQNCHRVQGRGSRLGPDLSDIGLQRPLDELRRSILDPNAEILPRNRFYRVMTRDGDTITGRLLNHDTFTVQLMTPKEELVRFRKSDLREYGFQQDSPMPSYEGKLAPEELADLIAYLASLRGISQ
jgi:putative heme-binding domain-containing protein